jgi:hypothetical protein
MHRPGSPSWTARLIQYYLIAIKRANTWCCNLYALKQIYCNGVAEPRHDHEFETNLSCLGAILHGPDCVGGNLFGAHTPNYPIKSQGYSRLRQLADTGF